MRPIDRAMYFIVPILAGLIVLSIGAPGWFVWPLVAISCVSALFMD